MGALVYIYIYMNRKYFVCVLQRAQQILMKLCKHILKCLTRLGHSYLIICCKGFSNCEIGLVGHFETETFKHGLYCKY